MLEAFLWYWQSRVSRKIAIVKMTLNKVVMTRLFWVALLPSMLSLLAPSLGIAALSCSVFVLVEVVSVKRQIRMVMPIVVAIIGVATSKVIAKAIFGECLANSLCLGEQIRFIEVSTMAFFGVYVALDRSALQIKVIDLSTRFLSTAKLLAVCIIAGLLLLLSYQKLSTAIQSSSAGSAALSSFGFDLFVVILVAYFYGLGCGGAVKMEAIK